MRLGRPRSKAERFHADERCRQDVETGSGLTGMAMGLGKQDQKIQLAQVAGRLCAKQARRLRSPGQRREQLERRHIAPVQVFQQKDQGRLGRERLQGLRHLAQHALSGGAQQVALGALAVRRDRAARAAGPAR
jgi:hypothetical protein